MSCVRFYICEHDMRFEKSMAAAVLADMVDVIHEYFDMLQVHRADNIVSPERGPIFVSLKDAKSILSLKRIFDGAVPPKKKFTSIISAFYMNMVIFTNIARQRGTITRSRTSVQFSRQDGTSVRFGHNNVLSPLSRIH